MGHALKVSLHTPQGLENCPVLTKHCISVDLHQHFHSDYQQTHIYLKKDL